MASSIMTQDEMKLRDMMPNWKDVLMTIVLMLFFLVVLCLCGVVSGCTSSVGKTSYQGGEASYPLTPKDKIELQEQIIYNYGKLLHEIWLDNPTYVEEALAEGDTFVKLEELMGPRFQDIFQFDNIEDSIQYHLNWDAENRVHVVKHIVENDNEESW